jgi:hypothetical protein
MKKDFTLGMEMRPFKNITLSAYADVWSHPWVTYRRDGLTDGNEILIKLAYTQKRKMDFYVQYRIEKKQLNSSNERIIDYPEHLTLQRLRFILITNSPKNGKSETVQNFLSLKNQAIPEACFFIRMWCTSPLPNHFHLPQGMQYLTSIALMPEYMPMKMIFFMNFLFLFIKIADPDFISIQD